MATKVCAIILSYNRPDDTLEAARSYLLSTRPTGDLLILVDNGPVNRRAFFKASLPTAIYLKNPRNLGFAGGNNVALRYGLSHGATHFLLLNPDATLPRSFLKPLLSHFTNPRVGLVAPALLSPDNTYSLGGRINPRWATFTHDNVHSLPTTPNSYDFVSFACVLIRAELISRLGYLDDSYFMYLEDVDYSRVATEAGYQILVDPRVVATHRVSASFADPRSKLRLSFLSALRYITKWYTFPGALLPLLHALYFYPTTYILWTVHALRHHHRP